jgi:hypothetical protein
MFAHNSFEVLIKKLCLFNLSTKFNPHHIITFIQHKVQTLRMYHMVEMGFFQEFVNIRTL